VGTVADVLETHERTHWLEPVPDARVIPADADPAEQLMLRQSIRLAFMAALQHLPPKQRAVLLLSEVLGESASEIATTLDLTVAAVNSALQRARATLATKALGDAKPLTAAELALVDRYVAAFERYDVDELVSLMREDATLCMPPFSLWLQGRPSLHAWLSGPGAPCRGSRVIRVDACGSPAYAQYRCDPAGGHKAWALAVLEVEGGAVTSLCSFLDTEVFFPLFGLPPRLD
jgi:RNA polymerase sigma-70 factor, ECF subfamily